MNLETIIALALALAFTLGYFIGRCHALIKEQHRYNQIVYMSSEETHDLVNNYLRSRINHPAYRHQHPEMDDEE